MTRQPGLRPGEIVAALNNISSDQSEGDPLSDTSDCDFFYPLVCSSSESSDNEHEDCVPEQVQHSVEGKYHTKVVWLANHFYTLFHTYAINKKYFILCLFQITNLHAKALEESIPTSQTSALGLQKKLVGPVALVKLQILTLEELHV